MAFTVSIDLGYEFVVRASRGDVFDLLSDVPTSASHFPQLERLVPMGEGCWRWEMQRIGVEQWSLQTVYACRYESQRKQGTVVWTPVEGVGNARVSGHWKISSRKPGTLVHLEVQGELQVPLPVLTRPVVTPLVQTEFEHLIEQYLDRLITRLGGEIEDA